MEGCITRQSRQILRSVSRYAPHTVLNTTRFLEIGAVVVFCALRSDDLASHPFPSMGL
jgi:hypothetical protein